MRQCQIRSFCLDIYSGRNEEEQKKKYVYKWVGVREEYVGAQFVVDLRKYREKMAQYVLIFKYLSFY